MIARIDEARSNGDTIGGVFEVVAHGLPIGLGSYVQWDRRLDAALAAAVMSINIVKGVEFGLGFEQTRRFGSAVHDVIEGRGEGGRWIHRTNNAGGLTGGVTNGEPLVVRGAVKPISTLAKPLPSADLLTGEAVDKAHYERSDISVVPAAGVVGEAMVMLILADAMLDKFGGDSLGGDARQPGALSRADLEADRRYAGRRRRPRRRRRGRLGRGRLGGMDVVLVGLPGSGKSAVGRRLAHRHGAVVRRPRRFDREGRRSKDPGDLRRPTARPPSGRSSGRPSRTSGPPIPEPAIRRVVATGGGAVVDPRNRWALYRGRLPIWLDGRPEVLAQRLRRSPNVRPLVTGRDPIGAIRDARPGARAVLRRRPPAQQRVGGRDARRSGRRARRGAATAGGADPAAGTVLLRADTSSGHIVIGEGIAASEVGAALGRARRAPGDPRLGAGRVGGGRRVDRRTPRRRRLVGRAGHAAAGRGREAPGGRRGGGAASLPASGRNAASRSSRSAAGRSATRRASSPRPGSAACRSSTSRRRSSPRSIRRSAARPASTCRRARTSSGRSTSRPRSSSTSRSSARCPSGSGGRRSARR